MNRKHSKVVGAIALGFLISGVTWAMLHESVDPAVAELEAERSRVFSPDATDADRQAFRQRVDSLTDEQRRQLFERGRPQMRERMQERMDKLFDKSPEELRREARARAIDVVEARQARAMNGDSQPAGPPWARGDMTEAQRDQRRKEFLDMVDPSTRGQMSEFRNLVDEQLTANGHDPLGPGDMRAMMRGG